MVFIDNVFDLFLDIVFVIFLFKIENIKMFLLNLKIDNYCIELNFDYLYLLFLIK